MKRLLLAVIFSSLVCSPVLANAQLDADINEKLSSIGFGKLFAFDPQEQIKNLFKDYENSGNNHKLNQLKNFYSEKYVNGDGFSYASYFDLVKQTWEMYPDIEYSFEVKNIIVNGDYATVQVYETAKGTAKEPSEYLEDKGQLESTGEYIYYLKKFGNRWKIISDTTISEKTFLKYGEAKDIAFDVVAPGMIGAGEEYSVTFAVEAPKDKLLLGSITNEKITYPNERPKEVFRKIKESGMLERIVKANDEGYNEQAVVSVGITKTEVTEEKTLSVKVSGVAFLMTRVNVVQVKQKNLVNELGDSTDVEEKTEL